MLNKLFEYLRLTDEKEDPQIVIERITKDSVFKGTNLWVLVFAIFIASLGLNVNSTAVIIGAMLISPLMGPIMGIGMGVAINDLHLVRDAIKNFSFAVIAGLITSFVYFSITPLSDAYSELLARTTPTVYDVLIAFFGGMAGIVANSSKQKGNVIPGVAIATALMPPLCTAGYGLATFQLNFFLGAIYLFTINTVFIALATFITLKYLNYPIRHLKDPKADKRSLRIIYAIALLTIIPSIYFGYEMIKQNKFITNANLYIESYSSFDGTYLLNKKIDPQSRSISLIYGGRDLSPEQTEMLKNQLRYFGLADANLIIKQGLSFLGDKKESERISQLTSLLQSKESALANQKKIIDSLNNLRHNSLRIFDELRINYPQIVSVTINPFVATKDTSAKNFTNVYIKTSSRFANSTKNKIEEWLRVRLQNKKIRLIEFTG